MEDNNVEDEENLASNIGISLARTPHATPGDIFGKRPQVGATEFLKFLINAKFVVFVG